MRWCKFHICPTDGTHASSRVPPPLPCLGIRGRKGQFSCREGAALRLCSIQDPFHPAPASLLRLTFASVLKSLLVISCLPCRSFDGFSSAQKNQEQLLTLASVLREEGKVFDEKVYYTAGYSSPFELLDRNNEVWLIQKNGPSEETE